ncbi:MAG: hypothetical protein ACSW77_06280 [Bacteroidales bacterium]|jgi:hypothetical protein
MKNMGMAMPVTKVIIPFISMFFCKYNEKRRKMINFGVKIIKKTEKDAGRGERHQAEA